MEATWIEQNRGKHAGIISFTYSNTEDGIQVRCIKESSKIFNFTEQGQEDLYFDSCNMFLYNDSGSSSIEPYLASGSDIFLPGNISFNYAVVYVGGTKLGIMRVEITYL